MRLGLGRKSVLTRVAADKHDQAAGIASGEGLGLLEDARGLLRADTCAKHQHKVHLRGAHRLLTLG